MSVLLYNRSSNSILSSTIRITDLVKFAKENNYKAIALTDSNVLFGAYQFMRLCKTNNIKPLIGLEVKVKHEDALYNYLIYPKNNNGYFQLMQISSQVSANINSFIEYSVLQQLTDCFVVVCTNGYIDHLLNTQKQFELEEYLSGLKDYFFVSVAPLTNMYNKRYNEVVVKLCNKFNIKTIATKLAVYANKEDYLAYKTVLAIGKNTTVTDTRIEDNKDGYLLSQLELKQYFDETSLYNTDLLAENVVIDMSVFKTSLPKFINKDGLDSKVYLKALTMAGLKKRLNNKVTQQYLDRVNYELDIITKMNFEEYFLIIYDLILFARRNDIYVGPGRGSSVGSLVAYCLGITHLDPISCGLLFERFLNPERISMPDIDIDFPDDRREEVINYVIEKYGKERVSHIITFGTFGVRSAIRDSCKALNINDNTVNIILNNAKGDTLSACYEITNFKTAINSSDNTREMFEVAKKIEGLSRSVSIHAGGIVMSEKKLTDVIPMTYVSDVYTTQYDKDQIEDFGLIKIDFLSLKNLSTIAEINKEVFNKPVMNLLNLPLNDKKTFDLLASGDTSGIFQLDNSAGMRKLLIRMKPTCLDDIAAVNALYRPGPMQYIDLYLENRNNPSKIKYLHPDLKPILQQTYGIIVYQEQVMMITNVIAGFTLGKADILRKSITKKNSDIMISLKKDFINGGIAKGYSRDMLEACYLDIEKFAGYGFNKSHSYIYSVISYQLAYFKANYPLAFYKALMNSNIGSIDKISANVNECRKRAIKVLPPDINKSESRFIISNDSILFPLATVKDVSNLNSKAIVKDREINGNFKNYFEAVARLVHIGLSQKSIVSLINAGGLDCYNLNRSTMINNLETCISYGDLCLIDRNGQQYLDFDLVGLPALINYSSNEAIELANEYEALSMYLRTIPTANYRSEHKEAIYSYQLSNYNGSCTVILMISDIREHKTKTNEEMCFISGIDEFGNISITLMPKVYNSFKNKLHKGDIVLVTGDMNSKFGSITVKKISVLKG